VKGSASPPPAPSPRGRGSSAAAGDPLGGRLSALGALLEARFGRPDACAHSDQGDPLYNLVLTILSQNTTDGNRDRAFARLVERYPSAPALAAADPAELADTIRVAGLPKAKAGSILAALARLSADGHGHSLEFLRTMGLDEARRYLVSFPGVGVKTANILLLFSFGLPAFPVDTHVFRVTSRLGLLPRGADLGKAALHLEPHVAPGEHGPLHLNLIRLGKEICRPAKPKCPECPVLSLCPEGAARTGGTAPPPVGGGPPAAAVRRGAAGKGRRSGGTAPGTAAGRKDSESGAVGRGKANAAGPSPAGRSRTAARPAGTAQGKGGAGKGGTAKGGADRG
jgi:endonuclease-3